MVLVVEVNYIMFFFKILVMYQLQIVFFGFLLNDGRDENGFVGEGLK